MRTPLVPLLAALLFCFIPSKASAKSTTSIIIPANSSVPMELTRPVWSANAKAGDIFYAETATDFSVNNVTAIPYGTYIEGTISSLNKPTQKSSQAVLHLQFDKIIFPNGYTVVLSKPKVRALVTVKVTAGNDLLLDNGAQLTMTFRSPLTLDANEVAQSQPLAQAPDPDGFVPATLCRFIPGTPGDPGSPGTSDTVIPGSPGTPDTIIPGTDGAPDTVIPGIPATPDTIIPGSPAVAPTPPTPPIYCPDPPAVVSSVLDPGPHTKSPHTSLGSAQ